MAAIFLSFFLSFFFLLLFADRGTHGLLEDWMIPRANIWWTCLFLLLEWWILSMVGLLNSGVLVVGIWCCIKLVLFKFLRLE